MVGKPPPAIVFWSSTPGVRKGTSLLPGQIMLNLADGIMETQTPTGVTRETSLKGVAGLTPASVGLGNVSNLAPADLPVSTAQAAAISTAVAPLATTSALSALSATVAALTAGADPSVDTFIEVFNRFLSDESAAAATTASLNNRVRFDASQTISASQRAQLYVNLGLVGIGPLPFSGATAPAGTLFCYGQAISRTTYAALFAVIGTAHGGGDGSTTFNIPDMRGRAPFGKDDMGGSASGRLTSAISGIAATTLGASGGSQSISTAVTVPDHNHLLPLGFDSGSFYGWNDGSANPVFGSVVYSVGRIQVAGSLGSGGTRLAFSQTTSIAATASNAAPQNLPPATITNYIIITGV